MRCEPSEETPIDTDNLLIGSWSQPEYDANTIAFKRVNQLPEDNYGLTFKTKGAFTERTSGWCGTPPLVFSDYSGNYTLSDAVISITQDHYPNNYAWRILSLTEEELVLTKELTEQEQDHRDLMEKFDEALSLIEGIPCENEKDWTFTAYGAKACGGPKGFIGYPTTIDTDEFLTKISIYTEAEGAYNTKWGVFSTCDVPQQPIGVECVDGYPNLKF